VKNNLTSVEKKTINHATKQTALILEIDSFKQPEPSEKAIEQVNQVLPAPNQLATTGDNVCRYCTTPFTSTKSVKVHLSKSSKCKAKAKAEKSKEN
jgi:hypothetical protein